MGLVLIGVLATPGPIYPPLGDGIAWNVLDLDLTTEPTVVWTTEVPESVMVHGQTGDVIVMTVEGELAEDAEELPAQTVVGLDLDTGLERWQIDDPDRSCQFGTETVTCVEGSGDPGAVVSVYPAAGSSAVAHEYPGAITAVALDDGGLLVTEGGGTGIAMLVRLDADGGEMWRSRLTVSGQADPGALSLEFNGDYVTASGGIPFDLRSGERADMGQEPVEIARDGTTRQGGPNRPTQVIFTDGTEAFVRPGTLWLGVDDAFGGPVALTIDADGSVVSSTDGRSAVIVPEGTGWSTLRLDGVLVVQAHESIDSTEATQLMGIDQLTGAELWTRSGGPIEHTEPFTRPGLPASADTFVVCTEGQLEGIDPRTGEPRWSIPVANETARVVAVDGGLLVWSGTTLMRLS